MTRKTSRRRTVLKTIGGAGTLAVAGCLGDDDEGNGNGNGGTDGNGNGGNGNGDTDPEDQQLLPSATIALGDDPTLETWDLYGGVTPYWTNILEPLVWVTDEMELEPWLATDWEATDDDVWEFTLREGVQFHNGEEMTAEDVVFSFEEILDFHAWAPGWIQLEPGNIEAIDEYTVEFTTVEPYPPFPGTIAHNMVAIQHPDRDHSDGSVIGTGPFQVEEIETGQEVRTTAFDSYWEDEPALDELVFRVIEDPNTRALSLENREVDVALSPPRSQVSSLEDDEGTHLVRQERPAAGYAGINIHRSPTDDETLRRALNHAVSSETIVNTILEGVGTPARGPISPIIYWSAHDELAEYEQDEDQATSLVEESSYDGETLTILVANDLVDGREMAEVLHGSFTNIGIEAEIQELERAAFSEAERDGEAHVILQERGSNSGDADYLLYDGFHSDGDVNQRLYGEEGTGLHNLGGEVDDLIETGMQTSDDDEKTDAFLEVQRRIVDQAVVLPLYYSEFIAGHHDNVDGFDLGAIPQFSRWTSLEHWE